MNKINFITNLEAVLDFIINSLTLEIKAEKLSKTVEQISRELKDTKTNKWSYPLVRTLDNLEIKNYVVKLDLSELKKLEKEYFPLITFSSSLGWLAITKKTFSGFEVFVFESNKSITINGKKLFNSLEIIDNKAEFLAFEYAYPIELLASQKHHIAPQKRLWSLLKRERKDIYIIIAYSIVISILSLVIPVAIQALVNTIAFATVLQPLVILTLLVIVALGFQSVLKLLSTYVVEILQRRVFVRVASDLAHRLPKVTLSEFDKNHGPEMVNRFFDVLTVQKSSASLLIDGLSIILQTLTGMILLAFYHPILLVFDLILLLCLIIITFVFTIGATGSSIKESKLKYKVAAWLEELALHNILFKNPSAFIYGLKQTDNLIKDYLNARKKHFKILLRFFSGSLLLQVLASSLLLGIGGLLVMEQQLSIGQLVSAEIIVTSIVRGVSKFGKQLENYYDLLAAVDKLGHLVDLEIEKSGGETLSNLEKPFNVKTNKISFSYEGSTPIIQSLSFEVASGCTFAIYALEGKGKSTIADLLSGFRTVNSGLIEINNIDLEMLDIYHYRNFIAYISQIEIFHGSILENIRAGRTEITFEEIKAVLIKLDLWESINTLKEGINTELSTQGSPLSSSMAIKLMLARALLAKPKLIIIDSILDQLSNEVSSYLLKKVLSENNDDYTLIITTKNKYLANHCEKIYDLASNKIVNAIPEVL